MSRQDTPAVAIVGMAGRFPGARNLAELWRNLRDGVESIRAFSREEAAASGLGEEALADPRLVAAAAVLDGIDLFDADLYGYSPRDAELMDPQQRLFLECVQEALEDAGCDPGRFDGAIGLYAGAGANTYLNHLMAAGLGTGDGLAVTVGNEKDYLCARIAYKLDLRGPCVGVQSACSTSLVAVHLACQALLHYECDLAVAGGVSVRAPQRLGYVYQEEGILSPDGHCRPFDARARGTVFGSGLGAVVLKRLDEALADGDAIRAVIRGSAVTHDGARKAGFTAPGVEGQVRVIEEALESSGIDPATITYLEAHGTGTALGDPIEIAAATQAYRSASRERGYCAVGSVKGNLGHLDAAAGISGLLKTVLALRHRQVPPSLHFETPNPRIDFAGSPFFVNTALADWRPRAGAPRRAGVSSFGLGGTNAHLILEEAPPAAAPAAPARPWQLLTLSARSRAALEQAAANLARHLDEETDEEPDLADVAWTLQAGRKGFPHRRAVVCDSRSGAIAALRGNDPARVIEGLAAERPRVAFLLTGQGAQRPGVARELYAAEAALRAPLDECCDRLRGELGLDLRELLFPAPESPEAAAEAARRLDETALAQPALFVLEYALARLWASWGVHPEAMIGHSVGELVAACLAGVFTLPEALALVAARGRLMQALPRGAMLAVHRSPEGAAELLEDGASGLALAAVNGPGLCVLSGPAEAIAALERRLSAAGEPVRRLHTSHAFHSEMMRPAVAPFAEAVARCRRGRPAIPFLSNLTGTWITPEQAADPSYWALQLVSTVRFGEGLATLLGDPGRVLLEVGPGETLARIARDLPAASGRPVLSTLGSDRSGEPEAARVLAALGGLWSAGVEIDWPAWHGAPRRRVPLPPYPFEHRRYWLEAGARPAAAAPVSRAASAAPPDQEGRKDLEDWFYAPSWKQGPPLLPAAERAAGRQEPWLVLTDPSGGAGEALAAELSRRFDRVVRVVRAEAGGGLRQISEREYALDPAAPQGFERLLDELRKAGLAPRYAVHAWQAPVREDGAGPAGPGERFARSQETGLHALLDLVRAWQDGGPLDLFLVADRLFDVTGDEALRPEQATLSAAGIVIPQEYAGVRCRTIDVDAAGAAADPAFAARLARELLATGPASVVPPVVALRGRHRWLQSFEPLRLPEVAGGPLREGGVYLITGGLGGLGRVIAGALFERVRARLVLVGRTGLPAASGEDPAAEERIRAVRDLESRGAEVLVLKADVSRVDEIAAALEEARRRFGAVNGVIHAAGVPGAGLIQLKTREMIDAVFAPKVSGALALDAACARLGLDLDFLACFSSNASVTGAVGQVDYCAANAFLDAFAHDRTRAGRPTLTIDWDWWQSDTWQEASLQGLPELQGRLKLMRQMYGIRIEEGLEAFWRLLASPVPQVVVSTKDLHTTIFKHSRMMAEIEHAVAPAGRERPLPADTFVAPRNEMEERIARIWQEGLGIDRIGVQDNFFALGGHSLLAVRLISELRKAFQIEITMDLLIQEAPTVAGLAEAIVARQLASADDAELSAALAELGELSDEEVRLLLAGELGAEGA